MAMKPNAATWRLDRRISLSVVLELMVLASLIVGSWVNLQRQLDLLQHDVTTLLQSQRQFQQKIELLSQQCISYEYRLQAVERRLEDSRTNEIRQGAYRTPFSVIQEPDNEETIDI